MALALLRLRRAVALSAALSRDMTFAYSVASSPCPLLPAPAAGAISSLPTGGGVLRRPHSLFQSLSFRSSAPLSSNRTGGGIEDKIGPDEILFEGCDYNHWLITMDFPKDPAPTREEMIETYIQTLAKVVGSVEEAKKRMYALSTTTYHGFQAVMTEEMSEKFRGLPGVVFILPDSYIDPVNKEYGGDKYDNGVITPRPPPIQYGRQGRVRSQNRYDRPNYNRSPSQGNMPNNQQGSREGDGWNYPSQQNYSQPGQYGRSYDAPGGRDFAPSGERREFGQEQRNYAQSAVRDGYQSERRDPMPSYQRNFGQGDRGNLHPQEQRNYSRGPGGENMYYNNSGYGDNRHGVAPGYSGEHRPSVNSGYGGENNRGGGSGYGGNYRQGLGSAYEPNHSGPPDGQQGSWQGTR